MSSDIKTDPFFSNPQINGSSKQWRFERNKDDFRQAVFSGNVDSRFSLGIRDPNRIGYSMAPDSKKKQLFESSRKLLLYETSQGSWFQKYHNPDDPIKGLRK